MQWLQDTFQKGTKQLCQENFSWAMCQLIPSLSPTTIKRWIVLHWETWLSFQLSEVQWPKLQSSMSVITLFSPVMFGGAANLRLTTEKNIEHYSSNSICMFEHPTTSQFTVFKSNIFAYLTQQLLLHFNKHSNSDCYKY